MRYRRPNLRGSRERDGFLREVLETFLGVLVFRAAWSASGGFLRFLARATTVIGILLMGLIALLLGAH